MNTNQPIQVTEATRRQIAYLQERGIEHEPNITKDEASRLIANSQADDMEEELHLHDVD